MDAIYNNSRSINLLNNNSKDINLVNNKPITNENLNKNKITTTTDSIKIAEKDENKINKIKALDAFNEASSEYEQDSDAVVHLQAKYYIIYEMMKMHGVDVPSFNTNDNKNTTNFLPFVDKMKDFINKENITNKYGLPIDKTELLDFCDLYKEKLVKYGCK